MRKCAVIMAGGSGTRLWPLSRRARPKQLLRIIDGRSLIRHAFERLCGLLAPDDIYVIALAEHLPAIGRELPDLPAENLIGEPMGRDTAAAIATSAAILHAQELAASTPGSWIPQQFNNPANSEVHERTTGRDTGPCRRCCCEERSVAATAEALSRPAASLAPALSNTTANAAPAAII